MRKVFENNEEKVTRGSFPMNLQFFASKGDDKDDPTDDNDDGGDEDNTDDEDEGEKDDQTKDSGKAAGKSGNGKSGKTFTQEQVNKMMTREKNQGRNAALKELGIDPKDTKAVKMVQAFIASQKAGDDEGDSNLDSEAQQKVQEATERALKAECKAEAMALGAKKEFVDDVVVLAMAKYDEDADFKTLIGEIKTKYKTFFDGESEEDKPTGKKGTGSALKKDKGKGNEEKSMGSRLAAQRVGTAKKTSNFMKRN